MSSLSERLGCSFFSGSLRAFRKKKNGQIARLGAFLSFFARFLFFSSKYFEVKKIYCVRKKSKE